jgi:hypothetical protein
MLWHFYISKPLLHKTFSPICCLSSVYVRKCESKGICLKTTDYEMTAALGEGGVSDAVRVTAGYTVGWTSVVVLIGATEWKRQAFRVPCKKWELCACVCVRACARVRALSFIEKFFPCASIAFLALIIFWSVVIIPYWCWERLIDVLFVVNLCCSFPTQEFNLPKHWTNKLEMILHLLLY